MSEGRCTYCCWSHRGEPGDQHGPIVLALIHRRTHTDLAGLTVMEQVRTVLADLGYYERVRDLSPREAQVLACALNTSAGAVRVVRAARRGA